MNKALKSCVFQLQETSCSHGQWMFSEYSISSDVLKNIGLTYKTIVRQSTADMHKILGVICAISASDIVVMCFDISNTKTMQMGLAPRALGWKMVMKRYTFI